MILTFFIPATICISIFSGSNPVRVARRWLDCEVSINFQSPSLNHWELKGQLRSQPRFHVEI